MKTFSFTWKYLCFFWLYSYYIFMPIIVSEFCPNKSSILSITLVILYFIIYILDENFNFIRKCLPFVFQLYSNCVPMPIIESECFSKNIINFINYLMVSSFDHTYVIWKPSALFEKVSSSSFNYILNIFVCLSVYLRFAKQILLLWYVILNFMIHMLD